jgi:tetratricopeptide (TPR) repeat protein
MAYPGRWERGTALVRKAIRLNPNYQGWYHYPLALDRFLKGEYELALKEAQKVNIPGFFWTQLILASIYGQMGREVEARTAAERLLELYPGFTTETARAQAKKLLMQDDLIEQLQDGLRKAGIEDPPPVTN